jgi:hypothetical protein
MSISNRAIGASLVWRLTRGGALCRRAIVLAVCLTALCKASPAPPAAADVIGYQPYHTYIGYTGNWQPSAQGTLVDVTAEIVHDTQGHVYDLHGNVFTVNTATNSLADPTGQIDGFVCAPVASPL